MTLGIVRVLTEALVPVHRRIHRSRISPTTRAPAGIPPPAPGGCTGDNLPCAFPVHLPRRAPYIRAGNRHASPDHGDVQAPAPEAPSTDTTPALWRVTADSSAAHVRCHGPHQPLIFVTSLAVPPPRRPALTDIAPRTLYARLAPIAMRSIHPYSGSWE